MFSLLEKLERVRQEAKPLVEGRWQDFLRLRREGSEEELFSELCFCILTANWSAQGGINAQRTIGRGFVHMSLEELSTELTKLGHRYPEARARFIVEDRWIVGRLRELLEDPDPREFFVKNVKGLGWKESSHFLRNVAFEDYAILDKHVLRLMTMHGIVDEIPKGWSKRKYLEYEGKLRRVASDFGEPLGKFDLYLWYLVKGRVDK